MAENFITIVSGLPRSGTSLMMQMLQAGGLPLLTDGARASDEHNPRGYFELEAVKHSRNDPSWLAHAEGKAVKVIHLLLSHLPVDRTYRVLFLLRNLDEVIASQREMLKRQGRPAAAMNDAVLAGVFEKQIASVREWLAARPNFHVLYLNHADVIRDSLKTAEQINLFLGGTLSVSAMAAAVHPELHRQRK